METTSKPTPREEMQAQWSSDTCICGALKQARVYWFCKMCWWSLEKPIRNALYYRPGELATYPLFKQAVAILMEKKQVRREPNE